MTCAPSLSGTSRTEVITVGRQGDKIVQSIFTLTCDCGYTQRVVRVGQELWYLVPGQSLTQFSDLLGIQIKPRSRWGVRLMVSWRKILYSTLRLQSEIKVEINSRFYLHLIPSLSFSANNHSWRSYYRVSPPLNCFPNNLFEGTDLRPIIWQSHKSDRPVQLDPVAWTR